VDNGDHSLAPPKRGTVSVEQTYAALQDLIVSWLREHVRERPAASGRQ
jgi:hypothetical protein